MAKKSSPKDPRYELVEVLVKKKMITSFKQIFTVPHMPKSLLAGDMGLSTTRLTKLLDNPKGWTVGEVIEMAKLFKLKPEIMHDLIHRDIA